MATSLRQMKVFYNGSTGSLGQYFGASLLRCGIEGRALHSRLEDSSALLQELRLNHKAPLPGAQVFLVQMAALVSVAACEKNPTGAFKINVTDTLETVETFVRWARRSNTAPTVLYVSTGHVYKAPSKRVPVTETHELAPRSVYARSKLEAEEQLKDLAVQLEVPLLVGRVFGLIAPRQPPHYVLPGLIKRVQMRALTDIPGLEYCRDYLDARDVCDSLAMLCTTAAPKGPAFQVVNVCSGQEVSIRHIVKEIIRATQPNRQEELMSDLSAGPGRPDDIPWLVGSCRRFEVLTGRKPQQISLPQTIQDALSEGFEKWQC